MTIPDIDRIVASGEVPVFHHMCGFREVRSFWSKPHDCAVCRSFRQALGGNDGR